MLWSAGFPACGIDRHLMHYESNDCDEGSTETVFLKTGVLNISLGPFFLQKVTYSLGEDAGTLAMYKDYLLHLAL